MTRAKSRTIRDVLVETNELFERDIDQIIKEIETMIKASKPEKPIYDNRRSPKTTGKVHGTKDFVIGYSDGIDQYEANLLKALE